MMTSRDLGRAGRRQRVPVGAMLNKTLQFDSFSLSVLPVDNSDRGMYSGSY